VTRTFALIACVLTIVVSSPAAATSREAGSPIHCRSVKIPTGLAAGAKTSYTIYGELCTPPGGPRRTIQILVHGGTYSHTYWAFPGFHGKYQYSRVMNRAGYATLAIDLLGVGRSSHPPSGQVTITVEAYAVHVAIQAARHGGIGHRYRHVILVGHSLGTLTNDIEASTYHDEDGFIATGTSHGPGFTGFGSIFAKARPALLDPVTAPQIPTGDLGYLSAPGARPTFYQGGRVNPKVERADENTRQPVAAGYAATLLPYLLDTSLLNTNRIKVPVLLVNGRKDAVFCKQGGDGASTNCASTAGLKRAEAPYYARSAHLVTDVLADSGHDINLVPNAHRWYDVALRWCRRHVPPRRDSNARPDALGPRGDLRYVPADTDATTRCQSSRAAGLVGPDAVVSALITHSRGGPASDLARSRRLRLINSGAHKAIPSPDSTRSSSVATSFTSRFKSRRTPALLMACSARSRIRQPSGKPTRFRRASCRTVTVFDVVSGSSSRHTTANRVRL